MTGIIIGASADSIHGIKTAQQMGHYVIAFDGDQDAEGFKHADYAVTFNIRDPQKIIDELKKIKPDFIIPVPIGRYLTTAGCLSDYYNIKGISYESSILCTDKYLYHEKLSENNLRPIQCVNIPARTYADDVLSLIHSKQVSFPIIVKPRHGSGSRGVSLINSVDEFKDKVLKLMPFQEDYVIESVIDGDEYGIDGVVIEGHFKLVLLRKKSITPPPTCQCTAYVAVIRTPANEAMFSNVEVYMEQAVNALSMRDCLLHADVMINDEFEVCSVEISGRPSGHRLHDVFTPLASGVDMIKEFISYSCNESYDFMPRMNNCLAIRYFDFENCRVVKQPMVKELMKKYDILKYTCNIGNEILGTVKDGHSIMDRGHFILSGRNEDDALRQCQEIIDMFVIDKDI